MCASLNLSLCSWPDTFKQWMLAVYGNMDQVMADKGNIVRHLANALAHRDMLSIVALRGEKNPSKLSDWSKFTSARYPNVYAARQFFSHGLRNIQAKTAERLRLEAERRAKQDAEEFLERFSENDESRRKITQLAALKRGNDKLRLNMLKQESELANNMTEAERQQAKLLAEGDVVDDGEMVFLTDIPVYEHHTSDEDSAEEDTSDDTFDEDSIVPPKFEANLAPARRDLARQLVEANAAPNPPWATRSA